MLQVATDDAASGISFGCLSSSDAYPLTCPARETLPVYLCINTFVVTPAADCPSQSLQQTLPLTQQVALTAAIFCSLPELEDAVRRARTEEIRIPFGVGIAGCVAQNKEIINIKDAYKVTLILQGVLISP